MNNDGQLRKHIIELLDGKSAHIDLESALKDFPSDKINDKPGGSPHSAWQLLEHIRIAQRDILDFCRKPNYKEMKWPDDYWPNDDGTKETWDRSVKLVLDDLQAMREIVSNESTDLFAKIPHGSGQTILREAMLVADHNAYHVGQIVFIKKMLES